MAHFGWVLFLNRSELRDLQNAREFFVKRFKEVEQLFTGNLQFASKQEIMGTACITGSDAECQQFSELLKEKCLGTMMPNEDCIRPAR